MTIRIPEDGPPSPVFPGPSGITGVTPAPVSAPVSSPYLVVSSDSVLTQERVLTAGTNISLLDGGGGGSLTISADATPAADQFNLPGQNSDIATTSMLDSPPAGEYLVEIYLMCTTADAAAGTLAVTVGWTDAVGATSSTPITGFSLAATGRTTARQLMRVASGNLTFSTAITGIYGTSVYSLHFRIVSLG